MCGTWLWPYTYRSFLFCHLSEHELPSSGSTVHHLNPHVLKQQFSNGDSSPPPSWLTNEEIRPDLAQLRNGGAVAALGRGYHHHQEPLGYGRRSWPGENNRSKKGQTENFMFWSVIHVFRSVFLEEREKITIEHFLNGPIRAKFGNRTIHKSQGTAWKWPSWTCKVSNFCHFSSYQYDSLYTSTRNSVVSHIFRCFINLEKILIC